MKSHSARPSATLTISDVISGAVYGSTEKIVGASAAPARVVAVIRD